MTIASLDIEGASPAALGKIAADTIGPLFVGNICVLILLGSAHVQSYTYFRSCKRDPAWRKVMVLTLCILQLVHAVMSAWTVWKYQIQYAESLEDILHPNLLIRAAIALGVVIDSTCQAFSGWRVWRLSGMKSIYALTVVIALVRFGLIIELINEPKFLDSWDGLSRGPLVSFVALGVSADVITSVSLALSLRLRQGQFTTTNRILRRYGSMSIQTGVPSAIASFMIILLFFVQPHNTSLFTFAVSIPGIYVNCLLAMINARLEFLPPQINSTRKPSGYGREPHRMNQPKTTSSERSRRPATNVMVFSSCVIEDVRKPEEALSPVSDDSRSGRNSALYSAGTTAQQWLSPLRKISSFVSRRSGSSSSEEGAGVFSSPTASAKQKGVPPGRISVQRHVSVMGKQKEEDPETARAPTTEATSPEPISTSTLATEGEKREPAAALPESIEMTPIGTSSSSGLTSK